MSAQPAGPPPAAQPARPSLFAVTSCGSCGNTVREVKSRDGGKVLLDGRDPDGEWWAVKVGARWTVTTVAPGETPPAGGWRYLGHRCQSVTARRVSAGAGTAGPCAGGCGGRVPQLYSGGADPLCPPCRRVLETWRATPGQRSAIPYGRWTGGIYTPGRLA